MEPRTLQGAHLRIDAGAPFARRPTELTRPADGERFEVSLFACIPSAATADIGVLRRLRSVRPLEPGDVVTWDTTADEGRRHVHGTPLWYFLDLLRDLESRDDVEFPERIGNWIDHLSQWTTSPWFDRNTVHTAPGYGRGLWTALAPALAVGKPFTCAVYLESARRVLHTLVDVRRGRLPRYFPRLLPIIDAYDPLSKLTVKDRERARPIARALEEHTLVAMLGDHARLAPAEANAA